MSYQLEPGVQRFFDLRAGSQPLPLLFQQRQPQSAQQPQQQQLPSEQEALELRSEATAALAEDPVLAFMLRLDCVLSVRRGVVTCLATVRRNVHHYELLYLQRFKQIAEPDIRHPKTKEKMLLCLDPKVLQCGQRILVKVQTRRAPMEPMQLLREFAILRANYGRDPAGTVCPRPYLFGCLGNDHWRVVSTDQLDNRQLAIHKRHFLLCQWSEDSLQRLLDSNRSIGNFLAARSATRLGREMLVRLRQLHSLGWTHGDIRPASFLVIGGDDLLLSDFVSASPIHQDCLPTSARVAADTANDANSWGSVRFPMDQSGAARVFCDLEAVVYILCSLVSPTALPWEAATDASADRKLALWRFAEADGTSEALADIWQAGCMEKLLGCSMEEAAGHPAHLLASALGRLHRTWTAMATVATTDAQGQQQLLPDYQAIFDSLK